MRLYVHATLSKLEGHKVLKSEAVVYGTKNISLEMTVFLESNK